MLPHEYLDRAQRLDLIVDSIYEDEQAKAQGKANDKSGEV